MRIIGLLILIAGIVLLAVAWNQYSWRQDIVDAGSSTVGTVSSVSYDTSRDDGATYTPTYLYRYKEATYYRTPSVSTSTRAEIGDTETLYVSPDDPNKAFADTFVDRWFAPFIFGVFGSVATLIGLTLLLIGRRSRRRRQQAAPVTVSVTPSTPSNTVSSSATSGPFVSGNDASPGRQGPFL